MIPKYSTKKQIVIANKIGCIKIKKANSPEEGLYFVYLIKNVSHIKKLKTNRNSKISNKFIRQKLNKLEQTVMFLLKY